MPSPTISTSPRRGEPHRAAAARTEHHLLRIDRRLAAAVAGKEGAVDRERRAVGAARHQRHHRRPDAARGMLQPGMEAERRRRSEDAGRARRDRSRPACRQPASRTARWRARPRCAWRRRDPAGRSAAARGADRTDAARPFSAHRAARPQRRDDPLLVAAGVAAHQHLAVVGVTDRQARLAIVMGRAARHPAAADLAPAEGLGDGLSGHGAPRRCPRRSGLPVSFAGDAHLGPRPFGEDGEEAGDVLGDLPGVLAAQITPEARLPDLAGARSIRLSFAACDGFTEDLTGGSSPLRAPGLRSRNPTDDAGP